MQSQGKRKNITEWTDLISKKTKYSLVIISFFILIGALFIRIEVDSQNRMVDVTSLVSKQEVILSDLNQRIIFLAKSSSEGKNNLFLRRIQDDIKIKIADLSVNHAEIIRISNNSFFGVGFFNYKKNKELELLGEIDSALKETMNELSKVISYNSELLSLSFNKDHGEYLKFLPNPRNFSLLSEYNRSVVNSSLRQNDHLSLLHTMLLLIILCGIWLIWILVLKPVNINLKHVSMLHEESSRDLEYQVKHDELTGLYNRNFFSKVMENITDYANTAGMYFFIFDLDKFKSINDRYGHQTGDFILKRFSDIIKYQKDNNELQFRIGGDEFAIILFTDKNIDYVKEKSMLINRKAMKYFYYEGRTFRAPVSIGISHQLIKNYNRVNLMRSADHSLYFAKNNGGNRFSIYSEIFFSGGRDILTLENEIFLAVEKKQFEVFYQPILHLPDNKIVAIEALLRWNHESLGLVLPLEWMALAQRNNLLPKISSILIDEVKVHIDLWRQEGVKPVRVNINGTESIFECSIIIEKLVSPQLKFPDALRFPIGVEIAETVILDRNFSDILKKIQLLTDNNVTILLDDFGTGYATLSHLIKLPFDILKIDKSFIINIDANPDNKSIVEAMIKLTKSLGKKIICEGVEDELTLNILKKMGCEYVQGYYYSRPVSFSEITELMTVGFKTKREKHD